MNWLQRLYRSTQRQSATTRRPRSRVRLSLEGLETRLAPAASVNGFGLLTVDVRPCVTVPVFVAVGGFVCETIVLWVALEIFFTVITSLNPWLAMIVLTGLLDKSVV